MNFEELLVKNKTAVIDKWFDVVVDSYPSDTARFIKRQKDPFSNPVGGTTLKGLTGLIDELLGEMNPDAINSFLDPIIRIRAVQNFTPSQATSFIFSLKKIIRDSIISKKPGDHQMAAEMSQFDQKIDSIGLTAFDIYMKCREQIFQLKANEEKNRTYNVFKRAGLIKEIPDCGPEI